MLMVACAQSPQEQYRLLGGQMGRKLVPGGARGLGGDLAVCFGCWRGGGSREGC